jgi:hypothetical protein
LTDTVILTWIPPVMPDSGCDERHPARFASSVLAET